jgi:hypothetical protein
MSEASFAPGKPFWKAAADPGGGMAGCYRHSVGVVQPGVVVEAGGTLAVEQDRRYDYCPGLLRVDLVCVGVEPAALEPEVLDTASYVSTEARARRPRDSRREGGATTSAPRRHRKGRTLCQAALASGLLHSQRNPSTGLPLCVGWRLYVHSFQPTFSSLTKNPFSANCRAALAESCQSWPQQ